MSSKEYFSKLNYTLANEDTSLECKMLAKHPAKKILAVCGSGGRSLPLVTPTTETLVCVDLAEQQLALAKLRWATIGNLNFSDFLRFWGFPPFNIHTDPSFREKTFKSLTLEPAVKEYFEKIYSENKWKSILYEGKWERMFTGVPRILHRIIGSNYDRIFDFTDFEDQKKYFEDTLNNRKWLIVPRLVLRFFGNAAFFNALLYRGHFVKKNIPEKYFEFYRHVYRKLFFQDLTRNNFFLQLTFLGELRFPEGNPIEAHEDHFNRMKAQVGKTEVRFLKESIIELAAKGTEKFDFVSLSDVPSYFSGNLEKQYLQNMKPGLNKGALVVVRCYLRIPENMNLEGFKDVTEEFSAFIEAEKTQMYKVLIYQFEG